MREITFGVLFGLFTASAALVVAAWPAPGRPVAALFSPRLSSAEIAGAVAASGGNLLGFGKVPALVLSLSDSPGYAATLYRSGAWLVVGGRLAGLCIGARGQTST